jgi:hypothetical protein
LAEEGVRKARSTSLASAEVSLLIPNGLKMRMGGKAKLGLHVVLPSLTTERRERCAVKAAEENMSIK